MKTPLQSKTIWLSLAVILLGALQSAQTLDLSPDMMGYVVSAIGFITLVLRFLTSTSIVDNSPVQEG